MSTDHSPAPATPEDPRPESAPAAPSRALVLASLAILVAFVAAGGRALCREWRMLRADLDRVDHTAVIGFRNVHLYPSYARSPTDWYREEGDATLLWAGWKHGKGHQWFRVPRGEVAREWVSWPMGRDVIQAIDYPLIEVGGGAIWRQMPKDSPVVGFPSGGAMSVYPIQVLAKVGVVNDLIDAHPFLLTFNPLPSPIEVVHVYHPVVKGRRITLSLSGYFHDRRPVLYDRGTESLWVDDGTGALEAVAGQLKGERLPAIDRLRPVAWGDWRWKHPGSRLLVGADRSRERPVQ